jgi:hypothetical protein
MAPLPGEKVGDTQSNFRGLCAMLPPSIRFPRVIHSHHRQLFQTLGGLSPLCGLCDLCAIAPYVDRLHARDPLHVTISSFKTAAASLPSVTSLHRQKVLAIIEFSSNSRLHTLSAPTTPPQYARPYTKLLGTSEFSGF